MPRWIPVLALLCAASFVTTAGSIVSTEKQIRGYMGMPSYVGVVPEHVKAALMGFIPVGSSRRQVEQALAAHRIGMDKGSACEITQARAELVCRLGIDHHAWELLRETYALSFAFDSSGVLLDVSVQSGLTWA